MIAIHKYISGANGPCGDFKKETIVAGPQTVIVEFPIDTTHVLNPVVYEHAIDITHIIPDTV
jgi:hypothetical protein